ncbi:MAG: MgtC/SapB family protein [Armatimonadia bacterium]
MHPIPMDWHDILARLGAAFLLGAIIGLERERHQRPAGLRTHILVALASALFAITSIMTAGENYDPGRIAAQVVAGIGFLGAGTIMRHGSVVRGLTTAASLWMAAALGLAAGFAWYVPALLAAVLAFVALTAVKYVEDHLPQSAKPLQLLVVAEPAKDPLPAVLTALQRIGAKLDRIKFGEETPDEGLHYVLYLQPSPTITLQTVCAAMTTVEGVAEVGPCQ